MTVIDPISVVPKITNDLPKAAVPINQVRTLLRELTADYPVTSRANV